MARRFYLFALLGCLVLVAAVWHFTHEGKISELKSDPQKYDGYLVTVEGRVDRSAGFLGLGIYSITDSAGETVLVVTDGGIPNSGTSTSVEGIFKQVIAIDNLKYYVILQSKNLNFETVKAVVRLFV